jgi:hypothetical protein
VVRDKELKLEEGEASHTRWSGERYQGEGSKMESRGL